MSSNNVDCPPLTPQTPWFTGLGTADLMRRRIFRQFLGTPQPGGNSLGGVLLPTVPVNRYWVLWHASAWMGQTAASLGIPAGLPGLWVYQPGVPLPVNDNFDPTVSTQGFRDSGIHGVTAFRAVPDFAVRIDSLGTTASGADGSATSGTEINMLRSTRYVLIGPGETLFCYVYNSDTVLGQGNYVACRLVYSEMILTPNNTSGLTEKISSI